MQGLGPLLLHQARRAQGLPTWSPHQRFPRARGENEPCCKSWRRMEAGRAINGASSIESFRHSEGRAFALANDKALTDTVSPRIGSLIDHDVERQGPLFKGPGPRAGRPLFKAGDTQRTLRRAARIAGGRRPRRTFNYYTSGLRCFLVPRCFASPHRLAVKQDDRMSTPAPQRRRRRRSRMFCRGDRRWHRRLDRCTKPAAGGCERRSGGGGGGSAGRAHTAGVAHWASLAASLVVAGGVWGW